MSFNHFQHYLSVFRMPKNPSLFYGRVFCFLKTFYLLLFFLVSGSLDAQPVKKIAFVKPDAIQMFSESELLLLDSVFQVTLSSDPKFPLISSISYQNDSVWVILVNEYNQKDRLLIRSSSGEGVPSLWLLAAGGTLTLLILLYFIRF